MSTVNNKIKVRLYKRINVFLHYITSEDIERKGGVKTVAGMRKCPGSKDTYSIQTFNRNYIHDPKKFNFDLDIDDVSVIKNLAKDLFDITSDHVINVVFKWHSGFEFPVSYYSVVIYDSRESVRPLVARLTSKLVSKN